MITNLAIVCVLTMIIHAAETLSYSIRYAGVKLNKIVVALSLTSIVVLVSRTANLIQAPMTAKFIDFAKKHPDFQLTDTLRIILLAGSAGTLLAMFLFPTCVNLFGRVIAKLEVAGSLPKLVMSVSVTQLKNARHYFRKPTFRLRTFRVMGVPKRFILLNIVVTAFYTVGVLASLYAAYLVPDLSTTASQASGIINGVATILLTIFIDPQLGLITERALHSEESRQQLGKIYILLMGARFVGTLAAQALILPAAYLISVAVQWI
ncbi:lipid II flippase Amj family protein [Paenibacillus phocaensis]|uniref:lipid II flippase Amj family protein n=1 Tax=Paenibacillus phocaensis TaxID=1776378 RepID=UPI0003A2A134|nr:lipid II flippase Amj family protein [Paenibacillus phocaensis]